MNTRMNGDLVEFASLKTITLFAAQTSSRSLWMTFLRTIFVIASLIMITDSAFAKGKSKKADSNSNSESASEPGAVPKSARERSINREARQKKGDKSKIDFESTDISGQRKLPLGSLVNQNKSDPNHDFVKLRWQWHPEMVQSASSIEGGRSR